MRGSMQAGNSAGDCGRDALMLEASGPPAVHLALACGGSAAGTVIVGFDGAAELLQHAAPRSGCVKGSRKRGSAGPCDPAAAKLLKHPSSDGSIN